MTGVSDAVGAMRRSAGQRAAGRNATGGCPAGGPLRGGRPALRRLGGLELVHAVGLAGLVRRASEQAADTLSAERLLPVPAGLRDLLPGGGLRRGSTLAIATRTTVHPDRDTPSAGATSLLLLLMAAAAQAGSWCAVVGVPTLNPLAAEEAGIALDRFALVPNPGPDWPGVVAALLDGLDVVVAAPPGAVAPVVAARLAARARQRGSVLVYYGHRAGVDLTLDATGARWHGLGTGRGRLQCRELTIVARGRGVATVPRRARIWLPAASGIYAQLHPSLHLVTEHRVEARPDFGGRGLAVVGKTG